LRDCRSEGGKGYQDKKKRTEWNLAAERTVGGENWGWRGREKSGGREIGSNGTFGWKLRKAKIG